MPLFLLGLPVFGGSEKLGGGESDFPTSVLPVPGKDNFATMLHDRHPGNRIGYRFHEHTPQIAGGVPARVDETDIDPDEVKGLETDFEKRPGVLIKKRTVDEEGWVPQEWTFYFAPSQNGFDLLWIIETADEGIPEVYIAQQCFRMSGETNEEWRKQIAKTPAFSEYDFWAKREDMGKEMSSLTHVRRGEAWDEVPTGKDRMFSRTPLGVEIDRIRSGGDLENFSTLDPHYPNLLLPNVENGLIARRDPNQEWICGIYWERTSHVSNHHPADCVHPVVNLGPIPPRSKRAIRGKIYWMKATLDDLFRTWRSDFGKSGRIRITVLEDGVPAHARVRVRDAGGEPVIPDGQYKYRDSFICDGAMVFDATPGQYEIEAMRGTEYRPVASQVALSEGETVETQFQMERWIDMNGRGWYAGDLHVHRPVEVIPSLMLAEDLNLCVVQSIWNNKTFWEDKELPKELLQKVDGRHLFHVLSEEDERDGGAILIFNLKEPIPLNTTSNVYPTSLGFIEKAHAQNAWVEQEKPFWWEAPVNVALGGVRSTEIANNHFTESWMMDKEAWGRPRDMERYPGQMGFATNVFDIYYHFLNAGFNLVATAGSATGVLPNPLGYNRCYVDCGEEFSYDRWFQRLAEGRNFVTNGPMLFFKVNGRPPGEPLPEETEKLSFEVEAIARTWIEKIEIVADGGVLFEYKPDGNRSQVQWTAEFPRRNLSWFAVRCFEPADGTVRFAHTGPVYVKGAQSPRRSKSAEFFVEWMDDLIERVKEDSDRYETEEQKGEVLSQYERARKEYWKIAMESPEESSVEGEVRLSE